jgi:hypothetical protein
MHRLLSDRETAVRDTRNILARICDPLRSPGRQSWFFLQPYSLPDAYLTCSLMDTFRQTRGLAAGDINIILKKSHAPIARMFPSERVRIAVAEDDWMESLNRDLRSVGMRSTLVPDQAIILHPQHIEEGRAEALLTLPECTRRHLYQYLLQLPLGSPVTRAEIPEASRREAHELARTLGMPGGRSVILMPHESEIAGVPPDFWSRLATRLLETSHRVFTLVQDHATGARCAPVAGSAALDIGLDLVLPVSEHAGWMISGMNDTLRLLVEAQPNCRLTALRAEENSSAAAQPDQTMTGQDDRHTMVIPVNRNDLEGALKAILGTLEGKVRAAPSQKLVASNAPAHAAVVQSVNGAPTLEQIDGTLALEALHEIQFSLSPSQRDAAAAAIVRKVNAIAPRFDRPTDLNAVRALQEHGIVGLGQVLSTDQLREVVGYFRSVPCYSAHVASYSDGVPRSVDQAARVGTYGSYRIAQALQAPHLLELALNEDLLTLCEHYLGCLPTLYSVHTWWTFAGSAEPGLTHRYHRDPDDHRFLSLFTYLTDVGPNDGPLDLLCGSHQVAQVEARVAAYRRAHPQAPAVSAAHFFPPMAGGGYDPSNDSIPIPYDALFADRRATVVGSAGSAFLADTFALHRGNPPTAHHRLACWIRFGLLKSKTYVLDRTHRIPGSQLSGRLPRGSRMDWVTRLLVDHDR